MTGFGKPFKLESTTGAQLSVRHQKAQGNALGIIHVNHGLADHGLRYQRFASALSTSGFHVFAHDHRGHGFTETSDAPPRTFSVQGDGVVKVLDDCAAVQAHALTEYPGLPLIMFGHSMGGLITMNFALRHTNNLAGFAVWNANFSGGLAGRMAQFLLKYERLRLGSDAPSRLLPKLTFADWARKIDGARTSFDWLSHIEEQVEAYVADPLCGWDPSVGMWLDVFSMVFAGGARELLATSPARHTPFHLLGGGEDPSTEFGNAAEQQADRLKNAGFDQVTTRIFPNARHETLNDLDEKEATETFIAFAKSCCSV